MAPSKPPYYGAHCTEVDPIREQTRAVVCSLLARTALELFAAKGYDDTTVDEFAAAAGVSRRTLFNYFRTKDDLALSGYQFPRGFAPPWGGKIETAGTGACGHLWCSSGAQGQT
ncbi:TetR/AcrR family transcriptional regulator [Arthrobacter sp. ISL-69]|uniref:TetR/AcrR family transcriptional regulator n=1 Tax=Arthrobacter sp. ISL-69 TaxID=2819113 RepID=UPI001BE97F06|nr:TetR family transcriptional regulator [Arthrobacter sp. ISL-69]